MAAEAVSAAAEHQEDGKMKQLDNFLEELKNIFGQRLKSVFIYGSKANIKDEDLNENINLMIITDVLTGEDLKKCSNPSLDWMGKGLFKTKNPEPVFMGENEWFNSADVYAMEYADIKQNHKILYGEDLICSLEVKKDDMRLQCERETKNLLMRFRSHYLLNSSDYKKLQNSIIPVVKGCNAIFKTILRLKDIDVPQSPYEVLNRIHVLKDIDKNFYEKLLCSKDKHCTMNKKETLETADKTVVELTKLLEYINNL